MGYIHRDLKPENIVLNINPLDVRVIDFDRTFIDSTTTLSTVVGTPGYFPEAEAWKDSDKRWDIWALAIIILESDLPKDKYREDISEEETMRLI
jgi:serine/threonine protein kinase